MSQRAAVAAIPPEAKRRPGRPSVAGAQRARIVEAYVAEARRSGLAGASVDSVASSLGISRALVFHYFGDLRALTRAVVEYLVRAAVRDMSEGREQMTLPQRRKALMRFAIAGAHFAQLRDVAIISEIEGLVARDESVATMIKEMWEIQIAAVVEEVHACYPRASAADCKAVGYALTCLAEQHWRLTFFGPGANQSSSIRRAAEVLLATLEKPSSGYREVR